MRHIHTRHIIAACAVATLLCSACSKTCTCTRYDGTEFEYTREQVKAAGVSCSEMREQGNTRYFAYCKW